MPPENKMAADSSMLPVAVDSRGCERERVDQALGKPLAHARSHKALSSDQRPLAYARSHTADGAFKGMLS